MRSSIPLHFSEDRKRKAHDTHKSTPTYTKMAELQNKIQKDNNKPHEKKILKSVQWDRNPHSYDA
jgi:hypothetical protein